MEDKKELTKDLLTASFRELVLQIPFEKITIKMITDGAGVIRPTFYKHFQDKYEVLEWILKTEIKDKIQVLIDNNMEEDIFRLLCNCLEKDHAFYRKAYEIQGQNSFEELMSEYIYHLFLQILSKYPLKSPDKLAILTIEAIARFYMRAEMNVPNNKRTKVYIVSSNKSLMEALEVFKNSVKPLMLASDVILHYEKKDVADDAVSIVVPGATVYLPMEELVDFEQELERLKKEEEKLTKEIARAKGMLSNERFVSKAPEAKVQEEKEKLEKYTQMLAQVQERLEGLKR